MLSTGVSKIMDLKKALVQFLNAFLGQFKVKLLPKSRLFDWQYKAHQSESMRRASTLPPNAKSYLRRDNPILQNLYKRYHAFQNRATESVVWTDDYIKPQDLLFFRGESGYMWQCRGPNMNEMAYTLAYYYIKAIDTFGLLDALAEDEWFGNKTFRIDGKLISRDLLDSILEIYFLQQHLNTPLNAFAYNILDIGAGYGRLAHRMLNAFDNIATYLCTDAVAVSTFICDYYLRFRQMNQKALVVPLDRIDNAMRNNNIDIAVNIHSFSECTENAITWWLDGLRRAQVTFLMIVPNPMHHGGEFLMTTEGLNFKPIVANHGYELICKEPKYRDPLVQKYAMGPTFYYLFKLRCN